MCSYLRHLRLQTHPALQTLTFFSILLFSQGSWANFISKPISLPTIAEPRPVPNPRSNTFSLLNNPNACMATRLMNGITHAGAVVSSVSFWPMPGWRASCISRPCKSWLKEPMIAESRLLLLHVFLTAEAVVFGATLEPQPQSAIDSCTVVRILTSSPLTSMTGRHSQCA